MKRIIIIISLFLFSVSVQARTLTKTINFVAMSHGFVTTGLGVLEGDLGIGLRSISGPDNGGFYWGLDLTVAVPLGTVIATPFTGIVYDFRISDLYSGLKMPLGYRWPGTGKSMGFYMGMGPAGQVTTSFDSDIDFTFFSFGAFGEIGFETNKTQGAGFHFGIRFEWTRFVYMVNYGLVPDTRYAELGFVFGISWRREESR